MKNFKGINKCLYLPVKYYLFIYIIYLYLVYLNRTILVEASADGIAASYIKTPKDRLGLSRVNNPWVALIIDSMKYYKPRCAFCELQVLNSA